MILFPSVNVATVGSALGAGVLAGLALRLCEVVCTRLTLRDVQTYCVTIAFHLALLVLLPISGVLTDHFGPYPVVATGSLLGALAIGLLATTRSVVGAMAGALLLGNSCACVWTASVVLMPAGAGPANLTAALNAGFVFFGVGLLLGPMVADTLLERLEVRRALGVLALLALTPALLAALTELEAFPAPDPAGGWQAIVYRPELWLVALALFLCLPVEQALTTWVARFLAETGHPEGRIAWLRAGFWLAFLAGRIGAVLMWERGGVRPAAGPWLVLFLALIAGIGLGNLAGARGRRWPVLVLLGIGAVLGPLMPVLIGLLFERFPQGTWGSAFGAVVGIGSLGTHLLLPLLGGYARRTTARQALWLMVVGLVLVALVMLALGIARTLRV